MRAEPRKGYHGSVGDYVHHRLVEIDDGFGGDIKAVDYVDGRPELKAFVLFAHEGLSKRAAQRIRDYLDGKVEKLEELEEPRLWFAGMGNPFIHNYFTSMIMTI